MKPVLHQDVPPAINGAGVACLSMYYDIKTDSYFVYKMLRINPDLERMVTYKLPNSITGELNGFVDAVHKLEAEVQ